MLLNAAVLVLAGIISYRFWVLSQFLRGGAKAGQIFFLTAVTGACLITNVILPFLIAGAIVAFFELREMATQD